VTGTVDLSTGRANSPQRAATVTDAVLARLRHTTTPLARKRSPAVGFTLPRSGLVARLGDLLRQLVQNRGPLPACITMITGPSASADIAGVRTLGVHGPGEVHVWIIENE
jgi:hypothetical protein